MGERIHHNNEYIWLTVTGQEDGRCQVERDRDISYYMRVGWMGGWRRQSGIQIKDKLNRLPRRNEQQTLHGMDDTTVTTST